MSIIRDLMNEMITYYAGDPKRIHHFIKVHSFARLIGEREALEPEMLLTLEMAAIVHDIGIKAAEQKFGACGGKLQEQEGPAPARAMLVKLGVSPERTGRICYLIAHHHTYTNVTGADYRILLEADFLVNLYEDAAELPAIQSAYAHIFCTETGKELCRTIFGVTAAQQ